MRPGGTLDASLEPPVFATAMARTLEAAMRRRSYPSTMPTDGSVSDVGSKGALAGQVIEGERYPAVATDKEALDSIVERNGRTDV